jgi:ParB-like chromosome segregation protein Spo0J
MKYTVHPVAEFFPLLERGSRPWNDLVDSIRSCGLQEPIVLDGEILVDGRNRLAACEAASIEPRFVQWSTLGIGIPVADWILVKNLDRRHLTEDQRVAIARQSDDWSEQQALAARKAAGQFKPGVCPNPTGRKGKEQVTQDSASPVSRDRKASNANSAAGRLAARAKTSRHKAGQAIAVSKAVDRGELPADTMQQVAAGKVKLKDASKKVQQKPAGRKPKAPKPLRDRVLSKFNRLLDCFPVSDHPEVKRIILESIA